MDAQDATIVQYGTCMFKLVVPPAHTISYGLTVVMIP